MKITVNGIFDYAYLFTRRDENFPSVIRISECTVEKNGEKEKSSDLQISFSTQFLKENILQMIELQGREIKLECEYSFFDNNYQLIKII
jgi:hypothetical protein